MWSASAEGSADAANAADAEDVFSTATGVVGGSNLTTETALTEPQSVAFCWNKLRSSTGSVKTLLDSRSPF